MAHWPKAILHGLEELSKRKQDTFLKAEFPHLWSHIEKCEGGKTEYDSTTLQKLLGRGWEKIVEDLVSMGFWEKEEKAIMSHFGFLTLIVGAYH